jgi:hypothetical protein
LTRQLKNNLLKVLAFDNFKITENDQKPSICLSLPHFVGRKRPNLALFSISLQAQSLKRVLQAFLAYVRRWSVTNYLSGVLKGALISIKNKIFL